MTLTTMPYEFDVEKSGMPKIFVDEVTHTLDVEMLMDMLSLPLLGDDGTPNLNVLIGPTGTGKTTTMRKMLKGERGVIFVDLTEVMDMKNLYKKLFEAISLMPPTSEVTEDIVKSTVERQVTLHYDKQSKSSIVKIVVDAADALITSNKSSPLVISWFVWLMNLSRYCHVVMICSDLNVEKALSESKLHF